MNIRAAVEFRSVTKVYPGRWFGRGQLMAVDGVTFRVEPGEVCALVGPNRAGKTTLVKMLLTLCRPTAGEVFRLGRPSADRDTLARVGYVHENQAFPRYLSPVEVLAYYGALALVPYEAVCRRAPALLERVGLADRQREPLSQFSKGMIQRLCIAQALINDPELLVLDEPSEGLDLPGRQLVRELVQEQRARGRTVLLVSHVLTEVEQVCDRLAVLVGGRLLHHGSAKKLRTDARTGAVRTLEQTLHSLYQTPSA